MNLRAPPFSLVKTWGQQLHCTLWDIQHVSDTLPLRFALGKKQQKLTEQRLLHYLFFLSAPEKGMLNNTFNYQKTTPTSFRSPFTVQGDLGFMSTNNKKYGAFFLAVQTLNNKIFVCPIKNNKSSTLVTVIGALQKVRTP